MEHERLASLDAFRGLTIAGMILVNNPGSWEHIYAPLRHADWHGWTPADLIFPFFLFIVGVSLTFSMSKRIQLGTASKLLVAKIFKRAILLFGLGFFLRVFPSFSFEGIRIPGVLQRIAICYLVAALVFISANSKARLAVTTALLAGYWAVMKLVPVPGFGAGILEVEGNLCSYIDTALLSGHLYQPTFDPEGILSTFPAVATVLLGTLAGDWLLWKRPSSLKKLFGFFVMGAVLFLSGLLLHPLFPINKKLWTSSFVILTAGAALLFLGLCYGIFDGLKWKRWAFPFFVLGTNAIAAYAGSILMFKIMVRIKISVLGEAISLPMFIYEKLLVPWAGQLNGSLIYAFVSTALWVIFLYPLYRKQIFIKI